MKLPCWISHDWDKYGKEYQTEQNFYQFGSYSYTVIETSQKRICKKCGLIQIKVIDRDVFNKNFNSER